MDWRRPLDAFEGATAYEVAVEALAFHQPQDTWKIANEKSRFSSVRFDLVHTTVGADVRRDDFLSILSLMAA